MNFVNLTAKANTTATERTASVTVSAAGTDPQSVLVTQAGLTGFSIINSAEIVVYPNPFNEGFYVHAGCSPSIVSVFDIRGKLILIRTVSGVEFIHADQLENGMYLIELTNYQTTIMKNTPRHGPSDHTTGLFFGNDHRTMKL